MGMIGAPLPPLHPKICKIQTQICTKYEEKIQTQIRIQLRNTNTYTGLKSVKEQGWGERGDSRYHRNCIQMSAFPPPKPSLSLIGCGVKTGEMSDVNIPQDPNLGPKKCL